MDQVDGETGTVQVKLSCVKTRPVGRSHYYVCKVPFIDPDDSSFGPFHEVYQQQVISVYHVPASRVLGAVPSIQSRVTLPLVFLEG